MAVLTKNYNAYEDLERLLLTESENCFFYQVNNYDGNTLLEINATKKPFDKKCYDWSSKRVLKDIKERTKQKLQKIKITKEIEINDIVRISINIAYSSETISKCNDIVVKLFYDEISKFNWI